MKDQTYVTHQPIPELLGSNKPLVSPIYQSVKFTTDTLEELSNLYSSNEGRYIYSRASNPTIRQLEVMLAKLQHCEDGICTASGVAAISTALLALLKQNDHVVMFYESYKPSRFLLRNILSRFGIKHTLVGIDQIDQLADIFKTNKTALLLFESPTNPTTRVIDVKNLINICKSNHVISILDNTFAGLHNHQNLEVDLYIHSLTKYVNGHGDALGGAILGSKNLIRKIRSEFVDLGGCMDPNTAFLMLRGLKTYFLRYERQVQNSQKVADWLHTHKKIKRMLYPFHSSHPDYEIAKKNLHDGGAIIAIELAGGKEKLNTFIDNLKLFQLSGSLGSTESLVAPIELFYGLDLTPQEKNVALITPTSARLAIGIEDASDLIHDLNQALSNI